MPSFDVVSHVDMQEIKNAIDQTQRELEHRYDFRGSKSRIELEKESITLVADDDMKLNAMQEILNQKMVKRGIGLRSLDYGQSEPSAGAMVKQNVKIKQGIDTDNARAMVKLIKDQKLKKTQASIQGDQVRISAPKKDDLQQAISLLKSEIKLELQFVNFKD